MKFLAIGAGYVGTPLMSVFSSHSPDDTFVVYDINTELIDKWNSDRLPYYEKGLKEILEAQKNKNLFFTSNPKEAFTDVDFVYICVNTPTKIYGEGAGEAHNLKYVESCVRDFAKFCSQISLEKVVTIIQKSTVAVGTNNLISKIFEAEQPIDSKNKDMYAVVSNPEFMAEGCAVRDLQEPDRVVLGAKNNCKNSEISISRLIKFYSQWVPLERIITTDVYAAEMCKLVASNKIVANFRQFFSPEDFEYKFDQRYLREGWV